MTAKRVLALGAGVQSSAALLMSCRGELPKLDAAIFADTQWEPREVYRNLEWLEEQAAEAGIPVLRATEGNIREDALRSQVRGRLEDGTRAASLPYRVRNADGSIGLLRRQCTREYKIDPIDRCVRRELFGLGPRQRIMEPGAVDLWFGISTDELKRVRMARVRWKRHVYPLCNLPEQYVERGFSRARCGEWLAEHYPGRTFPRSACIGCPFRTDREWKRLREQSPQEWQEAIDFDEAIRHHGGTRGDLYLHRKGKPLSAVMLDGDNGQQSLWDEECLGHCGV